MMAKALEGGRHRAGPRHRRQGPAISTRPRPRTRSIGASTASSQSAATRCPSKVRFTTWTLRYNRSFWVQVDGLEQHWERARVDADLFGRDGLGPEVITEECLRVDADDPRRALPARCSTPRPR